MNKKEPEFSRTIPRTYAQYTGSNKPRHDLLAAEKFSQKLQFNTTLLNKKEL